MKNVPYHLSFGDKTYCGVCHKPLLMIVPDWDKVKVEDRLDELPSIFLICRHCLRVSQVTEGVGQRKVEWTSSEEKQEYERLDSESPYNL
jgi:hypothetical protein